MRLTDSTEIRQLGNGRVVAHEGTNVATFVNPVFMFICNWEVGPIICDGDIVGVNYCNAAAVGFENGFACVNGHSHRNDVEYFDANEIEAARQGLRLLPTNARSV
jgi:hypothetical protein